MWQKSSSSEEDDAGSDLSRRGGVARHASLYGFAEQKFEKRALVDEFPESIYGAGTAFLVQSAMTSNGRVQITALFVILALLANLLLQFYILDSVNRYLTDPSVVKIRQQYDSFHQACFGDGLFNMTMFMAFENKDELCQFPLSHPHFFLAILAIWTGYALMDVNDTIHQSRTWCALDNAKYGDIQTSVDQLLEENESPLETCDEIVIEAASLRFKVMIVSIVWLPKLVIAVILWWIGTRWLTSTPSFENLMLNSVALAFVTDLDELMYGALIPKKAATTVGMHKLRSTSYNNRNSRWSFILLEMVAKAAIVVVVPLLYMFYFQQVLPGYRFDVKEHCSTYLDSIQASASSEHRISSIGGAGLGGGGSNSRGGGFR